MNHPELTGQAKEEWEKLERLVAAHAERQIEIQIEYRQARNRQRARMGLPPI